MAVNKPLKSKGPRKVFIRSTSSMNYTWHNPPVIGNKRRSSKKYRPHGTRREALQDVKTSICPRSILRHTRRYDDQRRPLLSGSLLKHVADLNWSDDDVYYSCIDERLRQLQKFASHLLYTLQSERGPQIPESWEIFKGVKWDQSWVRQASSTSSVSTMTSSDEDTDTLSDSSHETSATERLSSQSSAAACFRPRLSFRPVSDHAPFDSIPEETSIVCRHQGVLDPRTRAQWNLLATVMPKLFNWRRQTAEGSSRRDRRRHAGYLDLNQSALNQDMWPQVAGPPFMSFNESRDGLLVNSVHEQIWPSLIGRRLIDLVQTEAFPAHFRRRVRWPRSLTPRGDPLVVDYTCRATPKAMGWQEDICPVLLVAHYSPYEDDDYGFDENSVIERFTSAFRPMMALFILYYLDTRTKPYSPMPSWMILFGITYNRSNIRIQGHCPWIQSVDGTTQEPIWCAKTWLAVRTTNRILRSPPTHRGPLFGTLNRIQGHCKYVLEQLQSWEGYERACHLLNA
ncbi:hypothetical protein M408DRAFT_333437 [Serendipita vermifera MAFF 305830]|uniref:Uncharacterized protein n=1 Tax=Serendipita vermifera MAFF 305830 TaxID=933852 RepID=A0A0C2WVR0_SERVB|nr:hypothetical protein M408DRAFT_333437 [Serendipita vermifera MAFF 305830]